MIAVNNPSLRDIETPALLVDLGALERNVEVMASRATSAGVSLRPHAKTHKSTHIAGLQVKAGAVGIACATVAELALLASAGLEGLLLTAPQVETTKLGRIARINRERDIAVVVDHPLQVEGFAAAVSAADKPLALLVDVDVGQARTGVVSAADAIMIAKQIACQQKLEFRGIQGFAGHAQHLPDPQQRRRAAAAAAGTLQYCAEALKNEGLPPTVITGSGTGTYEQDSGGPYTELQVGSYVFMDSDYARIVDEAGSAPSFEPSLFVLAAVVSANRPGQVTVNAGTKALATNGPPPSRMIGVPQGSTYRFAGDEHGIIELAEGQKPPELGEQVLIQATHCDPTVNLHNHYHAVQEGEVQRWPISGRYGG